MALISSIGAFFHYQSSFTRTHVLMERRLLGAYNCCILSAKAATVKLRCWVTFGLMWQAWMELKITDSQLEKVSCLIRTNIDYTFDRGGYFHSQFGPRSSYALISLFSIEIDRLYEMNLNSFKFNVCKLQALRMLWEMSYFFAMFDNRTSTARRI